MQLPPAVVLTAWPAGRLAGWPAGWLAGWLLSSHWTGHSWLLKQPQQAGCTAALGQGWLASWQPAKGRDEAADNKAQPITHCKVALPLLCLPTCNKIP